MLFTAVGVRTPANVLSNFLPAVLSSPRLLSLFAYLRQEASNARVRLQSLKLPDIARTDQYGGLYAKPYTSSSGKI